MKSVARCKVSSPRPLNIDRSCTLNAKHSGYSRPFRFQSFLVAILSHPPHHTHAFSLPTLEHHRTTLTLQRMF